VAGNASTAATARAPAPVGSSRYKDFDFFSRARVRARDKKTHLDRRPYRPGKRNYVPVMIIAVAGILVLGRHLLSLMW
jgi:hypothetical protein